MDSLAGRCVVAVVVVSGVGRGYKEFFPLQQAFIRGVHKDAIQFLVVIVSGPLSKGH